MTYNSSCDTGSSRGHILSSQHTYVEAAEPSQPIWIGPAPSETKELHFHLEEVACHQKDKLEK